jgi:hypothetical protein
MQRGIALVSQRVMVMECAYLQVYCHKRYRPVVGGW